MKRLIKTISLTVLACTLIACGDETTSDENSTTAINVENVENLVFATNESTLRVNELAVDLIDAISQAHGKAWTSGDYFIQGPINSLKTMAVSFTDLDGDGKISTGDQVGFSYLTALQNHSLYNLNQSFTHNNPQLELTILQLTETASELVIRLQAKADNIGYEKALSSGLYNTPTIDRSNPNGFTPIETEPNTPGLPTAIDFVTATPSLASAFTINGNFLIDLTQIKSESDTTQTLTVMVENFSLDYFYSEDDIVLFSDMISGDFNFESKIAINENNSSGSLLRYSNGLLPPSSQSIIAYALNYFSQTSIDANLFSNNEAINFDVLTLSDLLGEKDPEIPGQELYFYDGKLLLSSENSFGTQINSDDNWQINIGSETFVSPVEPGLSIPFSVNAILNSSSCMSTSWNAGCTTTTFTDPSQTPGHPGYAL